jgi:hypothetical protein
MIGLDDTTEAFPVSAPHRRNGAGPDSGRLVLTSEFASVAVEIDWQANGPRLRIENQQNRRVVYLDPLELASLTWLTHESLGPFLDPSQTGWRSDEGAADDSDD